MVLLVPVPGGPAALSLTLSAGWIHQLKELPSKSKASTHLNVLQMPHSCGDFCGIFLHMTTRSRDSAPSLLSRTRQETGVDFRRTSSLLKETRVHQQTRVSLFLFTSSPGCSTRLKSTSPGELHVLACSCPYCCFLRILFFFSFWKNIFQNEKKKSQNTFPFL